MRGQLKKATTRLGWAVAVAGVVTALPSGAAADEAAGEANFTKLCSACHTVGGGTRVGPDLKDIEQRRKEAWLLKWIPSSQAMVKAGDPDAVAVAKQFNNIAMPDVALSPAEVKDVLAYIRRASSGKPAAPAAPSGPATYDEIQRGRRLFEGSVPLSGGGPACSSCHHVAHDAVIGGGVLAKELTTAHARMGDAGLHAIMSAPPFPVMAQAFTGKALTEAEIRQLTGYLKSVSGHAAYDQPREDSLKLLLGGTGGAALLLGLYAIIWRGRRRGPVNEGVFARQVRGEGP
ncbi:MAG: c-type cytochrome [Polyangiaceae bacterium]|nr:c-type cytochrome [Polyangiaceae bacterium]